MWAVVVASVGSAVNSDTRGTEFESSHRRIFMYNICLSIFNCIGQTKKLGASAGFKLGLAEYKANMLTTYNGF